MLYWKRACDLLLICQWASFITNTTVNTIKCITTLQCHYMLIVWYRQSVWINTLDNNRAVLFHLGNVLAWKHNRGVTCLAVLIKKKPLSNRNIKVSLVPSPSCSSEMSCRGWDKETHEKRNMPAQQPAKLTLNIKERKDITSKRNQQE